MDKLELVHKSKKVEEVYKFFFDYQYRLAYQYIIPFFKKNNIELKDKIALEIGCAEGGVINALSENGLRKAYGTDIAINRLENAQKITSIILNKVNFLYHNILADELPNELKNNVDIIILRDVIEHLDNTEKTLIKIKDLLSENGVAYITFPPYNSPFGGHQHTLMLKIGKLPYVHLLPQKIFNSLISKGRYADVQEVLRLRNIRLSPQKFKENVKKVGLKILKEEYFLIRPIYKVKYRLFPIKFPKFLHFTGFQSLLCTEASFLIKK